MPPRSCSDRRAREQEEQRAQRSCRAGLGACGRRVLTRAEERERESTGPRGGRAREMGPASREMGALHLWWGQSQAPPTGQQSRAGVCVQGTARAEDTCQGEGGWQRQKCPAGRACIVPKGAAGTAGHELHSWACTIPWGTEETAGHVPQGAAGTAGHAPQGTAGRAQPGTYRRADWRAERARLLAKGADGCCRSSMDLLQDFSFSSAPSSPLSSPSKSNLEGEQARTHTRAHTPSTGTRTHTRREASRQSSPRAPWEQPGCRSRGRRAARGKLAAQQAGGPGAGAGHGLPPALRSQAGVRPRRLSGCRLRCICPRSGAWVRCPSLLPMPGH